MTISCLASWYSELSHGWYAPDPLIDQDAEQERSENKDMLCSNGYDSFSIWKSCKTITTFLSRLIKLIQPKWQSIKPAQTFKVPKKINNGMIGNVIIAGEGLCSALRPLSSEGSLACHTYFATGHPFIMVISKDPWHSHLIPSVWQWGCLNLFSLLRSVAAGITPNLSLAVRML